MAVKYLPQLVSRAMEENLELVASLAGVEVVWDSEDGVLELYNMNTLKHKKLALKGDQNNEDYIKAVVVMLSKRKEI